MSNTSKKELSCKNLNELDGAPFFKKFSPCMGDFILKNFKNDISISNSRTQHYFFIFPFHLKNKVVYIKIFQKKLSIKNF